MSEDISFRLTILSQQIREVNLEKTDVPMFKNIFQCKAHVPFFRLCSFGDMVVSIGPLETPESQSS